MLENGNLKHFNLADLINILGQSKKTGELTINAREHQGTLYFNDGVLIHAAHGSLTGEEVVYELMSCESGEFSFNEKPVSVPGSINKTTDELIREGSIRSEIINRLGNKSFRSHPNSIVSLKSGNPENVSADEKVLIELLTKNAGITIIKLLSLTNFMLDSYVDILNNLINKGIVEIQKSEEEAFWESFQHVVNTFYMEFTSISGLKMSIDLEKKIQDLIAINTWNLSFKDGRIYTNELFNFPIEEQWKIYKVFLDELLSYFSKVYGEVFTDKVFKNLSETNPGLKTLLKKLNR
jgi:hypothetical protein